MLNHMKIKQIKKILKQNYYLSFKLILIGDSGVGESCLTSKAEKSNFEDYCQATVGFEFLTFNMKINKFVNKMKNQIYVFKKYINLSFQIFT